MNSYLTFSFGFNESVTALRLTANIDEADEFLRKSSIVIAEQQEFEALKSGPLPYGDLIRYRIDNNKEELLFRDIDLFKTSFDTPEELATWIVDFSQCNTIDQLIEYITLRHQAVRWYSNYCVPFLQESEREFKMHAVDCKWLQSRIDELKEALFAFPSKLGNIPVAFRLVDDVSNNEVQEIAISSEDEHPNEYVDLE